VVAYDWKPPAETVDDTGQTLIRRYSEMKADKYIILAQAPGMYCPQSLTSAYKLTARRADAGMWPAVVIEDMLARLRAANPGWKYNKCPDYWISCNDVRCVDLGGVECFDSKAPPGSARWTIYARRREDATSHNLSGAIGFLSNRGKGIVKFADMIRFTSEEIDSVLIYIRSLNPHVFLDKYYVSPDAISGTKSSASRLKYLSPIIPRWLYSYPVGRQSFKYDSFVILCKLATRGFAPGYISPRGWREADQNNAAWFGYESLDFSETMKFLFENNPGWYFRPISMAFYCEDNAQALKNTGKYLGGVVRKRASLG
jgi:hypothetical protein